MEKSPMYHPNRSTLKRLVAGAFVALLLAGCSNVATREIEAERAQLHREPLQMSAKGLADASIDATGRVVIGDDALALTDAQRGLTSSYRNAVIDLVDLALDESSRLTRHVMARSLFAMATGRLDNMEKKIEGQAEAMTHTPQFCGLLDNVRQRQQRMLQSVAKLKPYAHVSQKDVEDCFAGRPYETDL